MQEDIRASLDDLAIRWETPRGRELKEAIIKDARFNQGNGIADLLKDFMYVHEVPHGKDLRCITLDDSDITDGVFGKVDLSWASMANSILTRVDLRDANLKRANFMGANLALAKLHGVDCSRADFTDASLDGTHFKEAKLTGAVFVNADVTRASFDSANLAKTNWRNATINQTNFFNADCNNANFDSGALDKVAARPAKAWGIRWDMEKGEFEKQVGLKAITSRATKKFKGLDLLLKANKAAEVAKAAEEEGAAGGGAMFFGAGIKKREPDPEPGTDPSTRPTRAQRGTRRRPPPRPPKRGPGGGTTAHQRQRPPTGPQSGAHNRQTTARRPARPGGGPGPGQGRRPPPQAPPPKMPIAPFDKDAPEAATDWAKAIGQLMQLKSSVTKIVVELGDKSRIIFKKHP